MGLSTNLFVFVGNYLSCELPKNVLCDYQYLILIGSKWFQITQGQGQLRVAGPYLSVAESTAVGG